MLITKTPQKQCQPQQKDWVSYKFQPFHTWIVNIHNTLLGCWRSFPSRNFILIPSSISNFIAESQSEIFFIPILKYMSLNFIQSWPEFILSYPQNFNFIHLSLPKLNFILLSRNCVGTPLFPELVKCFLINNEYSIFKYSIMFIFFTI